MYFLIAVVLLIAGVICFLVPDPLPMIEEIVLVAGSIFTFIKGISDSKGGVSPEKYIKHSSDSEDSDSVYVYKPPKSRRKTPKGYPKYDKNDPDKVYYYKK